MPPLTRLIPPGMTPPDCVSLSINNEIVHVKGASFYTTNDTGVLQDCLKFCPQDTKSPLVIPRPNARPYTFVAGWYETNQLPEGLSENVLNEIAIEADFLDMSYLYREASVLYPLRSQINEQAPGSASKCLAIASYADLLDHLNEKSLSRQWFRRARQEAPQASLWLMRYYQKEVEKDTTLVLPCLRFATLNFSAKTDEFCGPNHVAYVASLLEDVLYECPGNKQAIAYLTQIARRKGIDSRAIGLLLADELKFALEIAPKDIVYQLCCLAACRNIPKNKHLLAHLKSSAEETEPSKNHIFEIFYQTISSEARAHPLARFLLAENSFLSSSIRPTQASVSELIDAADKLERLRVPSHPTSSIVPRSSSVTCVRRAMVHLLCKRGQFDIQLLRAASVFCLQNSENALKEFASQKFLLLVAGDLAGVWNAALVAGLTSEEQHLLNLELIYRDGGEDCRTLRQVISGLHSATQKRQLSGRGIVNYLCAVTLVKSKAATDASSLITLIRHLDSLPGGFSASSLLRLSQCENFAEMILSIEAQKVGSLTYFLLHCESERFTVEKRAWVQRRHQILQGRLDDGVQSLKLLRELAWSFYHLGQYTQALETLDAEQGHFPTEMAGRPVRALCLHLLGRTAEASSYLLRTRCNSAGALPEEASLLDYLRQMYVHATLGPEPALVLTVIDSLRNVQADDVLAREVFLVRCRNFRLTLENDAP